MSDLNLNVAMIGPRCCGKTSVLSIMLGELQNFINKLNNVEIITETEVLNIKKEDNIYKINTIVK